MRRDATAFASANGASEELAFDIALVVSEAVTNAVKYAYDSGREGEVELTAAVDNGFLEIAVRDSGAGFGSGSSDGLGLGLSIIARLSAEMTVLQAGDGTEVRMRFAL
jgi:anti-sigma regulatory factor (Ser/Thr protein kinase)